jgi:hypothetical protein
LQENKVTRFILQYYTSPPTPLDPTVLIHGLDIDVKAMRTIHDNNKCCISIITTTSQYRRSAMMEKLTPALYNANARGGIKISGSEGLQIYVNSDATTDQFNEHLELIKRIHSNDTSLGKKLPDWWSSQTSSGSGKKMRMPAVAETADSPETQAKMAAAQQASFEEMQKRMADIGQRMASKDDVAVIGQHMVSKDDIKRVASKDDIKRVASKDDIKRVASKDDIKRVASKDDIKRVASKNDINGIKITLQEEAKAKDALKQSQALHSDDKDKNRCQAYMLNELNKQKDSLKTKNADLKAELAAKVAQLAEKDKQLAKYVSIDQKLDALLARNA